MGANLPDNWLAQTLLAIDDETRRWPHGLKESYGSATGIWIGDDPRDVLLREAHDVLHKVIGVTSDRDAAHGEIADLMRRIREII